MRRIGVVLAVLGFARASNAAIVDAKSCGDADVQAAIDSAANGDTIRIPPGQCTWTTGVTLDASARELHLAGAGATATNINAGVERALSITGTKGIPWTVSNLGFVGGAGLFIVGIDGSSHEWRFHDVSFNLPASGQTPIVVWGANYGLIDHVNASGVITHFLSVNDDNWESWQRPSPFGTADAVFIEDCTIANTTSATIGEPSVLDGERGGRAVFRHNHVTNASINGHGFDSGNGASMLSQEIYDNDFTITNNWPTWGLGLIRGGTALLFDNQWTIGDAVWLTPGFALALYRNVAELQPADWGMCDGTQRRLCSNIDKNYAITGFSAFPCVTDQDCIDHTTAHPPAVPNIQCVWKFCAGSRMTLCQADTDCAPNDTCSAYVDGPPPDGYPCFQQVGFGGTMVSQPLYEWNNTVQGSANVHDPNVDFVSGATEIQKDRDYFDDVQPAGYVPYPYPHPLQGGPDAMGGPIPGSGGGGGCSCDVGTTASGGCAGVFVGLAVVGARRRRARRARA